MFRGPGVPTQCHPCHSVACAQCFHAFRNLHKYGALGLKNGPKGVLRQRGHIVRLAFDRGHAVRLVLALDHGHAGLKMADAPSPSGAPQVPRPQAKDQGSLSAFPEAGDNKAHQSQGHREKQIAFKPAPGPANTNVKKQVWLCAGGAAARDQLLVLSTRRRPS